MFLARVGTRVSFSIVLTRSDNIVVNTKVVYGAGDTAHAKLAALFGSSTPL